MRDALGCPPRRLALAAALALSLGAGMLAGCSSSGPGHKSSSSPAAVTTPAAPTTSAAATTPPPSSSPPLSPFAADPAVKALRTWADVAARAVNAKKLTTPALNATMTAAERKYMRYVIGGDIGLSYPGPLPFRPVRVAVPSTSRRQVYACVVADGFAVDPRTGKPKPYKTFGGRYEMVQSGGRWLFNGLFAESSVNCRGVKVEMPRWSS